jgi:regulatory protein
MAGSIYAGVLSLYRLVPDQIIYVHQIAAARKKSDLIRPGAFPILAHGTRSLMAIITKISQQKRRPTRRNIFLDGRFAFGCHENVVAKFALKVGMEVSAAQVEAIRHGEVFQECFDDATRFLSRRLHSRAELARKLARADYGPDIIASVLDELARLGYVDDERFARTKALSAAQHRHHGRRRALAELLKAGVKPEIADSAVRDVYEHADSTDVARRLALKHAARLKRLDPAVARRRGGGDEAAPGGGVRARETRQDGWGF